MDRSSRQHAGRSTPPVSPEYFNFVMAHLPPRQVPQNPGDWILRVVHFPEAKPEIAWDVSYANGAAEILQVWFEQSAKQALAKSEPSSNVPTEIGKAALPESEALITEVQNGLCHQCCNFQDTEPGGDAYALHFQHGGEVHTAHACNPRHSSSEAAEPWQRLLTRLIGSALMVPRRYMLGN